jgi:hypothetical protein
VADEREINSRGGQTHAPCRGWKCAELTLHRIEQAKSRIAPFCGSPASVIDKVGMNSIARICSKLYY